MTNTDSGNFSTKFSKTLEIKEGTIISLRSIRYVEGPKSPIPGSDPKTQTYRIHFSENHHLDVLNVNTPYEKFVIAWRTALENDS